MNQHYGHPDCTRVRWQADGFKGDMAMCTCPQPPPTKPGDIGHPGPDCLRCGRPEWTPAFGPHEYRYPCTCWMIIKHCACGRVLDEAAWRELRLVGGMDPEDDERPDYILELRNCICGTTLAIERLVESKPEAILRLRIQRRDQDHTI